MAEVVYFACALASFLCAALLFKGYRASRARLLLWSGICFAGLTINNAITFVDLVIVPDIDLAIWRALVAQAAMLMLVLGLVLEEQ